MHTKILVEGVFLISRSKETYKNFTFFCPNESYSCVYPDSLIAISLSLLSLASHSFFLIPFSSYFLSLFLLIFSPYFFPFIPLSLSLYCLSLPIFLFSLTSVSLSLSHFSISILRFFSLSMSFSFSLIY